MSDFFDDDEDFVEDETGTRERQRNLWIFAGIAGLVILVILLVIAVEQSKDRHQRRTARELGEKVTDYHGTGKKKSSSTSTYTIPEQKTETPETSPPVEEKEEKKQEEKIDTPQIESSIEEKHAYLSVVRIFSNTGAGSGTLLSRKGYFLTNYHVVDDSPFQFVFFSKNPRAEPEQYFATKIVFGNSELDVAVLQVINTYGNASLNDITPVKIGDSSTLKLGDELYIYGYPGIGGNTITLTRGVISGFLDTTGWIKTDANMASGNSGGGAFNSKGELVGIPTAGTTDKRLSSQISMIRPISNIKEHISGYL
jgi:S1-C subfamily serine protease